MALVSGPGRGGGASKSSVRREMELVIDQHVDYIRGLDTVRLFVSEVNFFDRWAEKGRTGVLDDRTPSA